MMYLVKLYFVTPHLFLLNNGDYQILDNDLLEKKNYTDLKKADEGSEHLENIKKRLP